MAAFWWDSLGAVVPDVVDLGRASFDQAYRRMLAVAEAVRAGTSPGEILLVEHEPVYTAGRATPAADLGPGIRPIERGGRITYHGPGQLVVYPVLRLPKRDLRDWLRRLETFGMAVCEQFGLQAQPSVDGTGVFVAGRKVASIGVAVRHWINLHGIAINVAMDLQPWQAIRPCGLDPEVISDLSRMAGRRLSMEEVQAAARRSVFVLHAATDPV